MSKQSQSREKKYGKESLGVES
uniref:Uncharacterized protein n=1 Tax=Rhizophora mucronata TaxID=61149 RepID=A0A2P2N1U2_RHIMU